MLYMPFQRSRFPMILQAMQSAKDEVQSITTIARSSVSGQAFHADVRAFPSQSESTIDHYATGYQSKGAPQVDIALMAGIALMVVILPVAHARNSAEAIVASGAS